MSEDNLTAIMENRRGFYDLLSRLYESGPSEALLGRKMALVPGQEDCPRKEMREGYRLLGEYLNEGGGRSLVGDVAADYVRIFQGAGAAPGEAAYPYESAYTSAQGLVMQEAWEKAQAFYAESGLAPSIWRSDLKEDHLAVELGFMGQLCAESRGEAALENLERQITFLEEHLLNWSPAFCADVAKFAGTGFYRGLASLTVGFLFCDRELLEGFMANRKPIVTRSYSVDIERMDAVLGKLKEDYAVFGPKLLKKRGTKGKDVVRYMEFGSIKDIVFERPSDFSAKEVYYPIMQTMFYFGEDAYSESVPESSKPPLLFLRACDINALGRLDAVFLKNGGRPDVYYARRREGLKIALLECSESHPNCFCVSMGANVASDFSLAVRKEKDGLKVQVKDGGFAPYFFGQKAAEFQPEFVKSNDRRVAIPAIGDKRALRLASELDFWKEYDEKCIGCGGCNTVCPTCSCFDTIDVVYDETSREGERRRVWSSCMLDTFTLTAGGGRARQSHGANMRFKALHKIHDFRERFGGADNMCVGCGRCVGQCPQEISFPDTVNRLASELEEAKAKDEGV